MRSIMSFAVLIAAIGFSGCCGTGGSCPLSLHSGKLGGLGAKAMKAPAPETHGDCDTCGQVSNCGCDAGPVAEATMHAPAQSDCGCGCGAPASSDAAACACGSDAVVSVSPAGDCGCGGSPSPPAEGGGCSSCGGGGGGGEPVVRPMQFSAPPATGGCSACQGASAESPSTDRGILTGRTMHFGDQGMGMMLKERGLACNDGTSSGCGIFKDARAFKPRSLKRQGLKAHAIKPLAMKPLAMKSLEVKPLEVKPLAMKSLEMKPLEMKPSGLKSNRARMPLAEKLALSKPAESIPTPAQKVIMASNENEVGCAECAQEVAGRHISHGFISDVRQAHQRAHVKVQPAGEPSGGLLGGGGHHGGPVAGGLHADGRHIGAGRSGSQRRVLAAGSKLRNRGNGSRNPYGGAIPYTAQVPGQSGIAPSYAYPYYTTRGPRDFLRDNPPSIGR